jgi:hypothetical protein
MKNDIYLFRIIHVENILHILKFGITHHTSPNRNPNYKSIGDSSLITTRSSVLLNSGKLLGEYIPFYFGYCMPMLYVIQNGFNDVKALHPEEIIYCVLTVELIQKHKLDFIFTNGHATNRFSKFYDKSNLDKIKELVDFKAVESKYWNPEDDLDLKRRKEAEFLVGSDIPFSAIYGFGVYNEKSRDQLINYGISENIIKIKRNYYF